MFQNNFHKIQHHHVLYNLVNHKIFHYIIHIYLHLFNIKHNLIKYQFNIHFNLNNINHYKLNILNHLNLLKNQILNMFYNVRFHLNILNHHQLLINHLHIINIYLQKDHIKYNHQHYYVIFQYIYYHRHKILVNKKYIKQHVLFMNMYYNLI